MRILTVVLLSVVATGILLAGCRSKPAPKPADPLSQLSKFAASADGTFYASGDEGQVFWIVNGKAAPVACEDKSFYGGALADPYGGVYVTGMTDEGEPGHLWYIRNGTASKVETAPTHQPQEVSGRTLMWSIRSTDVQEAFESGRAQGYAEGMDAGEGG